MLGAQIGDKQRGRRGQGDRADRAAVLGLGLLDDRCRPRTAAHSGAPVVAGVAALVLLAVEADDQRPGDRDAAFGEVTEPERCELAAPGAGLGLQRDERQQLVVLRQRGNEQPAHLVGRRRMDLRGVVPARFARSAGLSARQPHITAWPNASRTMP